MILDPSLRQEDRKEETLLAFIQKWIRPGTTIVSDCWKGYINLEKHGYVHKTVNHSVEFVNDEGFHTNKIEGHWRQMKADFIWRYVHRGEDSFWVFL